MRIILIFIFIALNLSVFAQKNQNDSNGKRHGVWEKTYENGKTRYNGKFEHGKEVGLFKFYNDRGILIAENFFRDKGKTAYCKQYSLKRFLAAEGKFIYGKKDSVWTYYDSDDNVLSRENFKNDLKHGSSITYYPNKKIAEKLNYKNGVKEGQWVQNFGTGKLKLKAMYVDGKLQGEALYYRDNGQIRAKGNYHKGLMDGTWYYFDDKKNIEKKEIWKKGIKPEIKNKIQKTKEEKIED